MSMGCSMAPMMFPGVQQYMPAMGMGIGMGMEMAAASGFVRPMLPFQQVMSGPAIPGPSASHLSPRFPMPPFNLPHIPPSDQTRVQATNMLDPASTSVNLHCTNMLQQGPNLTNPYHHYLGLHHMQGPPQVCAFFMLTLCDTYFYVNIWCQHLIITCETLPPYFLLVAFLPIPTLFYC